MTSVGLNLCWNDPLVSQSGCLSKQDEDESRQDGEMDTHGDATEDLDILIKDCYDCGVLAGSPSSLLPRCLFPAPCSLLPAACCLLPVACWGCL